jgi:hypothetical protein
VDDGRCDEHRGERCAEPGEPACVGREAADGGADQVPEQHGAGAGEQVEAGHPPELMPLPLLGSSAPVNGGDCPRLTARLPRSITFRP